jgi:Holliday junction DNA helicase RuvA
MIGYLRGILLENDEGKVLLGVGEESMVGYHVFVPHHEVYRQLVVGKRTEFFIYSHVKEESFDLFGFFSKPEKVLFTLLLSVSGVGPKSALGILSVLDHQRLLDALFNGDSEVFTQVSGIGKKTAARLVLELRDTVRKKVEQGLFVGLSRSSQVNQGDSRIFQDAKEALVDLGYREQEIQRIFTKILEDPDFQVEKVEDLIRIALRKVG